MDATLRGILEGGAERTAGLLVATRLIREELTDSARDALPPRVGHRLEQLTGYMAARLQHAALHGTDAPISEVRRLLQDLRSAWPSLDRSRGLARGLPAEATQA